MIVFQGKETRKRDEELQIYLGTNCPQIPMPQKILNLEEIEKNF